MVWNETSSSLSFSGDESEDLDHAIALSLLEEEQRKANASEISVDEDEQLARALQESLNAESPPCQSIESSPRESIESFSQESIESSSQESIESPPQQNIESPPHQKESFSLFHPKCDICRKSIPSNMNGSVEYLAHPFWMQKYCPSHERDGTPRCCSCERMEVRETKYVTLDDGRKLCLECSNSAVMDTNECQPLYLDIRKFFIGLNMRVNQKIPLLLVERQALNEATEGEKQGHHHLPEIRGLCLSEEQIVRTIRRRPRFGPESKVVEMITEPYRLTRQCEVTAILVLYGLPRLHTGYILAHEMMHAWLRLQGYKGLSPKVEEGICQVLAHMWIESEIKSVSGGNFASSSPSPFSLSTYFKMPSTYRSEKRFGEFIKQQIEEDSSPVYGDGFRDGNEAVIKYGLKTTLDHIKLTKSFPC